jgi:hypothetical protein
MEVECGILREIEVPDRTLMWHLFIQLILATDMAKHFRHVGDMNRFIQGLMLPKTADHARLARPFDTVERAYLWIGDEFDAQTEIENMVGIVYK